MEKKRNVMNDMVSVKKTVIKKPVVQSAPAPAPAPRRIQVPPPVRQRPAPVVEQVYDDSDDDTDNVYTSERPTKSRSGCLLWMIAIICIIALIGGIGGLFTHATITLTPKQLTGSVDTTINLAQTRDANDIFFGTATKIFTSEKVVPATGRTLSETKATGIVSFSNTNTVSKTIPIKTEITSLSGKKYITNKAAIIPAKGVKGAGQIDVGVTAIAAGSEGNSDVDDFAFSKPVQTLGGITIHSKGEITGGSSGNDAIADPDAITAASNALKDEFTNSGTLVARLSEQVPENMIALPLVLPANPISITVDPKHDDGVHVIATQTVTIVVVDRVEIARMLGNSLGAEKNMKLVLRSFGDAAAMTNSIVVGQAIPQKVQVRVTGRVAVFGLLDTDAIKTKILGMSRADVKSFIGSISEIQSFKLTMRPFWRRILPIHAAQVEVVG